MAFFLESDSSLNYCSVLFARNGDGSYNGILFGLDQWSLRLMRLFLPISCALAIFAFAELISVFSHLFFDEVRLRVLLECMDIAVTSITMILLGVVGLIQLYMQKTAIRTGRFYVFNHGRTTLGIDWAVSMSFYWIWWSSSLICLITIVRWHYLESIKNTWGENILLTVLVAIFFISCNRVRWLWNKRVDRIVAWHGC